MRLPGPRIQRSRLKSARGLPGRHSQAQAGRHRQSGLGKQLLLWRPAPTAPLAGCKFLVPKTLVFIHLAARPFYVFSLTSTAWDSPLSTCVLCQLKQRGSTRSGNHATGPSSLCVWFQVCLHMQLDAFLLLEQTGRQDMNRQTEEQTPTTH